MVNVQLVRAYSTIQTNFCPLTIADDGKIFLTPQGTYFQVKCGSQNTAGAKIPGSRPLHDFAECMTACADIPECQRYEL